jgi:hypothetical protein
MHSLKSCVAAQNLNAIRLRSPAFLFASASTGTQACCVMTDMLFIIIGFLQSTNFQ